MDKLTERLIQALVKKVLSSEEVAQIEKAVQQDEKAVKEVEDIGRYQRWPAASRRWHD